MLCVIATRSSTEYFFGYSLKSLKPKLLVKCVGKIHVQTMWNFGKGIHVQTMWNFGEGIHVQTMWNFGKGIHEQTHKWNIYTE